MDLGPGAGVDVRGRDRERPLVGAGREVEVMDVGLGPLARDD